MSACIDNISDPIQVETFWVPSELVAFHDFKLKPDMYFVSIHSQGQTAQQILVVE